MKIKTFKILFLILAHTIPVISQPFTSDSLIHKAMTLERAQDYKSAEKLYKQIVADDPLYHQALTGLGRIAVFEEEWYDALEKFEKALSEGGDSLESRYYLGICFREIGKAKAWILQKLDFRQSEKHFEQVILQDSSYQDVLYQRALLERYRDNYENAIMLCQAQIRWNPRLHEPQLKLYRFYRYLITHRSVEESYAWLSRQHWKEDRYFWGEKLRREGRLEEADSLFQAELKDFTGLPSQSVLLSRAKIEYEQNEPEAGQQLYWKAVDHIRNKLEADLIFEELKYIITEDEFGTYDSLTTSRQFIDFFRAFWFGRSPIPSLDLNLRLAEHFRRLIYSEKFFEYDGFRLWSDNPDKLLELEFPETHMLNQEFNDKGLIYLRHGEPDEKVSTIDSNIPTNESWLYHGSDIFPRMSYHFILIKPDNGWRLTARLPDPRMYEDRVDWGSIYYQLSQEDELARESYLQDFIDQNRRSVRIGLGTDRHTWLERPQPLNVAMSAETYRGPYRQTTLEISHIIPLSEIQQSMKREESDKNLEQVLAVYDEKLKQVYRKVDTLEYHMYRSEQYLMYFYQLQLAPQNYHIIYHIRSFENSCIGCIRLQKFVEDYSVPDLKISDIQVASFIEPSEMESEFVKNGLLVIPNPASHFSRDKPLYLYFELYNLSQSENGNAFVTIDYTLSGTSRVKKKNLFNLFGLLGKPKIYSISIQNEQTYQANSAVEYLSLNVESVPPGSYDLSVKVTDTLSGTVVEKQKTVYLQ
ncbi:MAG: tetratricopeptide repeat protein [bacterium]|nr:MAG: tetratricopeptide repeat protein [bacterium]